MPSRRITLIPETQLEFERPGLYSVTDRVLRLCAAIRRLEEGKTVFVRVPGGETIAITPGPDLEDRVHRAFYGDQEWEKILEGRKTDFIGPDGVRYFLPLSPGSPVKMNQTPIGLVIEFARSDGRRLVYRGISLPQLVSAWHKLHQSGNPPQATEAAGNEVTAIALAASCPTPTDLTG